MAAQQFTTEEIIRVVTFVLIKAHQAHAFIMQKFMVKDHFPELRGKLNTDKIDRHMMEICELLSEKYVCFYLLSESSRTISCVLKVIVNMYNVNKDALFRNNTMLDTANKVADNLIYNWFPPDDKADEHTTERYMMNLHMFSMSLLRMIYYLVELLKTGEIDLEDLDDKDPFEFLDTGFDDVATPQYPIPSRHYMAITFLQARYPELTELSERITDYCFPD